MSNPAPHTRKDDQLMVFDGTEERRIMVNDHAPDASHWGAATSHNNSAHASRTARWWASANKTDGTKMSRSSHEVREGETICLQPREVREEEMTDWFRNIHWTWRSIWVWNSRTTINKHLSLAWIPSNNNSSSFTCNVNRLGSYSK